MDISEKRGIDFVCCVHFYTDTLGKGMNLTLLLPSYGLNKHQNKLGSLTLGGTQSNRRKTLNSKP